MATAELWIKYRAAFLDRRIDTFRDLTIQGKRYKFFSSFGYDTINHQSSLSAPGIGLKPRR